MKSNTNSSTIVKIIGILFLILGIFIFLPLLGFHPEDSLYFSNYLSDQTHHFLGKAGVSISAFLFYFIGKSSYVFSFFLFYTGFILLRKISSIKKSGLIILSLWAVILSFGIFSRPGSQPLYKGGGLFGRYLLMRFSQNIRKDVVFITALTLFIGVLTVLLRHPVTIILTGLSQKFHDKGRKRPVSKGRKKIEPRDKDIFSERPIKIEKVSHKAKRSKKKPPLIRRVYYDYENSDIEPAIEPPVIEQDTGQYLLSESSPSEDMFIWRKSRNIAMPNSSILRRSKSINNKEIEKETIRKAHELERTLNEFGIEARVTGITRGPVITRYELQPAPGVKLSRIVNLSDNIALSLSANGVRIEAPIPGRSAVGIEIPNDDREIVTLGDILEDAPIYGELPLILGKDISGKVIVSDLAEMPHLLIAGATGSGKSVCVNSIIASLLFKKTPDEARFLLIDPKMVELKIYNGIPHLFTEVLTDPRDVLKALHWAIHEMENRYRVLDENYVRDITGYNKKVKEKLPFIIIIIDEFANLMAILQKEVEDAVVRLAAMSRAVGIHLIMATQRPSVDVITGLIKANFSYRIAFQVASKTDSRTILDTIGAEKLLGRGDMLFSPAGSLNIRRIQGAFISEEEVLNIVNELRKNSPPDYREDILSYEGSERLDMDDNDPIFDDAVEIVLRTKRASASFLQRRLKIGYNRAARIIELMEERGIIGPPRGSKPREIFIDQID
jgi:S-DNA-T family DNA segregation ATPase FtsK/SpoIIIE